MIELVNGNIVNEFDEIVGTYNHIIGDFYYMYLYGTRFEIRKREMVEKINKLGLYFEPVWG